MNNVAILNFEGTTETLSMVSAARRLYALERKGCEVISVTTAQQTEYYVFWAQ
jgi:4-hydroxy-3-methylbut-2-en-1-yl diphosphate synthase IspG/GcpE